MNDSPLSYLQQAMDCHQRGNLFDADRYYAKALEQQPNNLQALRLRGILARENGDIELALMLLRQAAELAPERAEARSELGLTLMMAGDLQAADDELRGALRVAPNSIDVLSQMGALLQHRGHLQQAIECYKDVLLQEPNDINVRCNLAKALMDANHAEQAFAEVDRAVQLSGGHPATLATHGAILLDAHRYSDARSALAESLKRDPSDDMARVNLALSYSELGDAKTATEELRKAVETNPYNARAVADLITLLSAAADDAEALELGSMFLGRHPGEPIVTGAYALALYNAGHDDDALNLLDYENLVQSFDLPIPTGFSELHELNKALAQEVAGNTSLIADPVSKSTTGGQQTGEFNLEGSAALRGFHESANDCIRRAAEHYRAAGLTQHPAMLPASANWSLRCWGTQLQEGGQQTPHMHPLGWLSSVYYVELPEKMAGLDKQAGWLEFGMPPPRYATRREPITFRVQPRAGQLHIFPSWFWHQTLPFSGAGSRVSMAFDVMPLTHLRSI